MNYIDTSARMSQAVVGGGIVCLAGQVAADASSCAADQTRQILATIDDLLALAGSHKGVILNATIWLRSMDDYDAFNAVWDRWIEPGRAPARACVRAELVKPEWLVEVAVIAVVTPEA